MLRPLLARADAALKVGAAEEAEALCRQALKLYPKNADALNKLGLALEWAKKYRESESAYRQAIRADPGAWRPLMNLSGLLVDQREFAKAEVIARKAAALAPEIAGIHSNLATALVNQGKFQAALDRSRRAARLQPDSAPILYDLSLLELTGGNFAKGWDLYEHRWKTRDFVGQQRFLTQPEWQGSPVLDGKLLVWTEQGVGDEVMFASVMGDLQTMGLDCVLECTPRQVPLFRRSFSNVEVVGRTNPPNPRLSQSDIVAQIAAGSLPRHLRRDAQSFSAQRPFLRADPQHTAALRERYLGRNGKLLVGFSWHSGNQFSGRSRSAELEHWRSLFAIPGVRWVSLQYGDFSCELKAASSSMGVDIVDDPGIDPLESLDDFAAQVAAMDLVVSVSNSTVHYAGALGVPVWTLLSLSPSWRWLRGKEPCVWYPTMRFFKQETKGQWDRVMKAARKALLERLN
jgi:tetratricopeptide (TPR) repeat protein